MDMEVSIYFANLAAWQTKQPPEEKKEELENWLSSQPPRSEKVEQFCKEQAAKAAEHERQCT